MFNRIRRMALALGVVCASMTATGLAPSAAVAQPSASAAAHNCIHDEDPGAPYWYCENIAGAPVYWAGYTVGYLYSRYGNWFLCRYEGDPTGGGGPHPNRWIYTQADSPALDHDGWGFVKDSDIYWETNVLPSC
ncbi:hypothetical protein ABT275_39440 [Streptomyces sp. NPDC001185]|uniref:hypothetical protein n=1 Tax=Streptomyces sp. NPDC001185 TaxID=3154380 RepID=UPI00331EBE3C